MNQVKTGAVLWVTLTLALPVQAQDNPRVPDLTKGGVPDKSHDWTLGPTGARGWIFGHGLETTDARQILITKVEKGSPADGSLRKNDVILGLNGKRFDRDARRALGEAITESEKAVNQGKLRLTRWRGGREEEIRLQLNVMGDYAPNAPYDCPKSEAILDRACAILGRQQLDADIVGEINALALLASGRPEVLPKVKALAHAVGPPKLKLRLELGMHAWEWGFACIFLSEYYLATLCKNEEDFPDDCKLKKTAAVEEAIRFIESSTEKVATRSIKGK